MDHIFERLGRGLLTLALAAGAHAAHAAGAALPARIQLIVPFSAAGPVDFSARVLADKMREMTGANVIIDNRPSANGVVAAVAVKQSPPTGETLLFASSGLMAITPHIDKNLPFSLSDFTPVVTTSYADAVLVVGPKVPAGNVQELVALAKSSPKPLAFASAGVGSILHGWLEVFKDVTKTNLMHVPYKGASTAVTDVMSGEVTGMFVGLSVAVPYLKNNTLKAIGIVGPHRSALAPDVPTLEEQGVRGIDMLSWTGILAPKGTNPEVVAAIRDAVANAMNQPDVKGKLQAAGITPWVLKEREFEAAIQRDDQRWGELIRQNKMALQ